MPVITHERLKTMLSEGPTRFSFIKTDGTTRSAYGTTNLGEIPNQNHPTGGSAPAGTTTFFDLEIGAWRAVAWRSEVSIP
jgi:hypothetical protein